MSDTRRETGADRFWKKMEAAGLVEHVRQAHTGANYYLFKPDAPEALPNTGDQRPGDGRRKGIDVWEGDHHPHHRELWMIDMLTKGNAKRLKRWWESHTGASHRIVRSPSDRRYWALVREGTPLS
jgi:hypothetical protein